MLKVTVGAKFKENVTLWTRGFGGFDDRGRPVLLPWQGQTVKVNSQPPRLSDYPAVIDASSGSRVSGTRVFFFPLQPALALTGIETVVERKGRYFRVRQLAEWNGFQHVIGILDSAFDFAA